MKLWNYKGEQKSISGALQVKVPVKAVISITGSGGKTSLMLAWARELSAGGRRTVMTTTTHMLHPDYAAELYGCRSVVCPSDQAPDADTLTAEIGRILDKDRIVLAAMQDPDNIKKVTALPADVLDRLRDTADVVIIEADGSRRMPLKWPAPCEPVVPEYTDITVCVAGLSALGQPLKDVMYRYDYLPEAFRRETADEMFITSVLASLDGGQKGACGEFRVFLNQADDEELLKNATHMQLIFGVYGIQSAWGSLTEQ